MTKYNIIVSITQNYIIGANNDLLITSKDDLRNFILKQHTNILKVLKIM